MNSKPQTGSTGRFFVKQAILLVITIALMIFCTIPLIKAVTAALKPAELEANVSGSQQAVTSLQTKLNMVRAKMLMGAGEGEAQEKLQKEIEELKRQLVARELENKNLQSQMALAQTMLELLKAKSVPGPVEAMDTTHKVAELVSKVAGFIASIFSGGMFVLAWWRKRRESSQVAGS